MLQNYIIIDDSGTPSSSLEYTRLSCSVAKQQVSLDCQTSFCQGLG